MVLFEIPPMDFEQFKRILNCMPEHTEIEVSIYGTVDYSSIHGQIKEVIPEANIRNHFESDPRYVVKGAEKDGILRIYKEQIKEKKTLEELNNAILHIHKVSWKSDGISAHLTPYEFEGTYSGEEPEYLAKIRREFGGRTEFSVNTRDPV